jgi:phage shock protein A
LSASSAESFARAALSEQKSVEQKIESLAKALIELAKTIGSIERDISRIKNATVQPSR